MVNGMLLQYQRPPEPWELADGYVPNLVCNIQHLCAMFIIGADYAVRWRQYCDEFVVMCVYVSGCVYPGSE